MNFFHTVQLALTLNFRINGALVIGWPHKDGPTLPSAQLAAQVAWYNENSKSDPKWVNIEVTEDVSDRLVKLYGRGVSHSAIRLQSLDGHNQFDIHVSEMPDGKLKLRRLTINRDHFIEHVVYMWRQYNSKTEASVSLRPDMNPEFEGLLPFLTELHEDINWDEESKDFLSVLQLMVYNYKKHHLAS